MCIYIPSVITERITYKKKYSDRMSSLAVGHRIREKGVIVRLVGWRVRVRVRGGGENKVR